MFGALDDIGNKIIHRKKNVEVGLGVLRAHPPRGIRSMGEETLHGRRLQRELGPQGDLISVRVVR